MLSQLKSLLGTKKRHIVVCGKLATTSSGPILVCLRDFKVVFSEEHSISDIQTEKGVELINNLITEFEKEFGIVHSVARKSATTYATLDSFTGAIVITTDTYKELCKPEVHNGSRRFTAEQHQLIRKFVLRESINYYSIFVNLLNRRIISQRTPYLVKGHFIRGLFQPVVVGTYDLPSPFDYAEYSMFYGLLKPTEKFLERKESSVRKLDLSCISMYDVSKLFNTPILRDLGRREFMFMLLAVAVKTLDTNASREFGSTYSRTLKIISENRALIKMFTDMVTHTDQLTTTLKVVN